MYIELDRTIKGNNAISNSKSGLTELPDYLMRMKIDPGSMTNELIGAIHYPVAVTNEPANEINDRINRAGE